MEIWIISSGLNPDMGGIASVTRSCLNALTRDRTTSPGGSGRPGPRVTRLIRLRDPDPAFPEQEALLKTLEVRNCGGRRRRCLGEVSLQILERPALLLYEHVDLAQCQTLIPRALRRPYAVWGHGIELWRALPPRKEMALLEADLLLFNSAFTREKAGSFHPWILARPWRVVPLCREGDAFAPATTADPPKPARHPWLLTVGRLHEDRPKGHREILATLPELLLRVPDLHWHIVGSGPWEEPLKAMIEASPARAHITFHGFLEKTALDLLYQKSRVFAMPSFGEGFGLVYAEAMAHGLPCVGSNLDAAPEVIGPGGVCVDPQDPEALREALAELLLAPSAEFQERSKLAVERARFFEINRFASDLAMALHPLF